MPLLARASRKSPEGQDLQRSLAFQHFFRLRLLARPYDFCPTALSYLFRTRAYSLLSQASRPIPSCLLPRVCHAGEHDLIRRACSRLMEHAGCEHYLPSREARARWKRSIQSAILPLPPAGLGKLLGLSSEIPRPCLFQAFQAAWSCSSALGSACLANHTPI